jgi:hypothetical protein
MVYFIEKKVLKRKETVVHPLPGSFSVAHPCPHK